jgi:hypothetical protein
MSNSSAPVGYTTISSSTGISAQDIIAIDMSTLTTTATSSSYYYTSGSGVTIGQPTMTISSNGNVGIGATGASTFKWKTEEFIDCFPDFSRIEKMCEQYPGLKIAYEKFKTVYTLVKDDYDAPKDNK